MNLIELASKSPAVVVGPSDMVIVKIDRYLTGQQLTVIHQYYQKKLPNCRIIVTQQGTTVHAVAPPALAAVVLIDQAGIDQAIVVVADLHQQITVLQDKMDALIVSIDSAIFAAAARDGHDRKEAATD